MTYTAHYIHIGPDIKVDDEGDFRFDAPALDGTRAAEGALRARITEQIEDDKHRHGFVVTRLAVVAP